MRQTVVYVKQKVKPDWLFGPRPALKKGIASLHGSSRAAVCRLGFDWNYNGNGGLDWSVDVNGPGCCTDGNDQRVANLSVESGKVGFLFPPAADWIDRNGIPAS
jgi:hypothetical protein